MVVIRAGKSNPYLGCKKKSSSVAVRIRITEGKSKTREIEVSASAARMTARPVLERKREDLTYHFFAHFAPLLEASQDAHKYHIEIFLEMVTYIASQDISASMGLVDCVVRQSSMDIS